MKTFKVFSAICLLAVFSMMSGRGWGQTVLPVNATFSNSTTSSITMPNGFTHSGLTGYSGSLKFDTQGESLTLNFSGIPNILIFDVGINNSFTTATLIPSTATFTVYESENGSFWTTTATYTNVSSGTKSIQLKFSTRFIKWEYTIKPSGSNIALKNISVSKEIEWLGTTSSNWNTATNWNPNGVPSSGNNIAIPSAGIINYPVSTSITIDAGASLTLQSGAELTLSGNLTNNGTLTLENGATLVQGASSSYSGTGTVQVKQNITGANNGSSPNGRFWYLGSPVAGGLSSILDAAGANVVKYWDEPSAAWVEITDNTSALTVGRGHYLRSFTTGNQTLTFTGGALNNGTYTFPLTANGSSFNGFNLVSNPYPSYLKWDDVAKNNVGTTIWYRTSNGANNMVFDTYNSNGNVGTSNNGAGTVSQFIPPMQAFWVKVEGNTSGSIVLENIDRSHHVSGMQGMHSLLDKQMFANINLIKDTMRDQAIVYSSYATADVFDAYDSEKMFQANTPQLYSKINDKKVVINAKNFTQRNEKTPLYMNIPSAGTYAMQLGEFNSSFGSIWLEDLSNGQLQNLLINDTYTFQTEAGQDLARFVLHFGYPEQIYGAEVFESVEDNFDSPVNWSDVSVVAADDNIIDLTASLNEIDAQQTRIVSVFDMTGRQIMSGSFENGNNQIQVPASNAVYMVHVTVGSAHKVFKVLIQQ